MSGAAREWIFEGAHLRAYVDNPGADRARATFEHRRLGKAGFDDANPREGLLRHGFANIAVQSARNDYYLNDDLPALRRALWDYTSRFDDVSAMGFSMGGFAALLMSRALRATQLWLVSPMSPTIPKTPPFDSDMAAEWAVFDRFGPDHSGVAQGGAQEVAQGVARGARGVVLFDPYYEAGRDRFYAEHVKALCPDIALLAMPWGGHPATQFLVEGKHYGTMQRASFTTQIKAERMKKVQRKFRCDSISYLAAVQSYVQRRAART